MIGVLVGGPAHGEEFSVDDFPNPTIKVPKLEPRPLLPYYEFEKWGDFKPMPGPMEIHEYRLLYSDGRYAIYRHDAPRVTARFQFSVALPIDDHGALYRKLRDLTEEGEAVKVMSFHYANMACSVEGIAIVDGPPDAKAAEDAAAAVKAITNRRLRGYQIAGFAVSVDDG